MSISTTLPVDTQNRRFVGPEGYLPKGTRVGSTDYAVPHVLLVASDGTTALVTSDGLKTQGAAAHDAAASGSPVLVGGYASASAPSDVSANGDAVRAWFLRNGALAAVLTAAGALIGGDATYGLDVDVTRVAGTGIYVAASTYDGGTGTSDGQLVAATAGLRLMGFSAQETTASAGASLIFRNGTSNSGNGLYGVTLGANESRGEWFGPQGIACAGGLWLERVSGTTQVYAHYAVVA